MGCLKLSTPHNHPQPPIGTGYESPIPKNSCYVFVPSIVLSYYPICKTMPLNRKALRIRIGQTLYHPNQWARACSFIFTQIFVRYRIPSDKKYCWLEAKSQMILVEICSEYFRIDILIEAARTVHAAHIRIIFRGHPYITWSEIGRGLTK